ncbi:MAG: aminotransferase [Muribaculaceae bacterium]|nr:aminotransferase [Muribaculaceae bacterium]
MTTDGIVIQARSGSTRMPAKILRPFDGDLRIIDILLERIKAANPGRRVVLATTTAPADDVLEQVARDHGTDCFRGSEEDVLDRFLGAADTFELERIVRVCSDNPFLQAGSFDAMFDRQTATGADYVGFAFPDGRPTIKSHLGLYAELATTDALRRAAAATQEKLYREHVTIYLYTHPDQFKLSLLPLPGILSTRTDLRLTLDTPADFALLKELYRRLGSETDGSLGALVALVDSDSRYARIMKQNIEQNEK